MQIWPFPLAPLLLAVLMGAGATVVLLLDRFIIRGSEAAITLSWAPERSGTVPPRPLPILLGFTSEILPALAALWVGILAAYFFTGRDYLWVMLPWATVTIIMLWPVGRRLGRSYLSYRSIGFIIGVISMAYIPFAGFGLMSDLSFKARSALFFGLVIDLTALGVLPGLQWFIGRPLSMFFRPDLLFGDGRVLATGTLALVLGLR